MKYGKRITAFIIALILTVYGLPAFPVAQASPAGRRAASGAFTLYSTREEPQPDEPENIPESAMRFIQKVEYNEDGTVKRDENGDPVGGFDPETGILTMCLQVKRNMELTKAGKVDEGVFMFQTDLTTVVPVTRPNTPGEERQQILGKAGRGAVVTSSRNPEVEALLNTGKFDRISGGTDSFEGLMSPPAGCSFNTNHTALLVARDPDNASLLDCYFQFRFDGAAPDDSTVKGNEGYITVMEFDFQCYAGSYPVDSPNAGQPKPAESAEALFNGSLRLPDADKVTSICDLFTYEKDGGTAHATLQSGAAFLQLYNGFNDVAFYYDHEPQLSPWRKLKMSGGGFAPIPRNTWAGSNDNRQLTDDGPGLWYENMLVEYVITDFSMGCTNTIVEEGSSTPGDFTIPSSELDAYPRYVVPRLDRANDNEAKEDWVPEAYLGEADSIEDKNPVPLKYYLGTTVTANSISSPEEEGLATMMQHISWEFLLDGSILLSDVKTEADSVKEQTLKISDTDPETGVRQVKSWTAKTFKIDDPSLGDDFQGKKLWKVYDETGALRMTCPVGIVMEMLPTEISYTDRSQAPGQQERFGTAVAPQLHVTNDAADPDSFIWSVEPSTANGVTSTPIYFWARYDFAGAGLHSAPLMVGMYRDEDSVPRHATLTASGLKKSTMDGVDGEFWVGKEKLNGDGNETASDAVANKGFVAKSTLQDQYGLEIAGKWNTLTLTPDTDTAVKLAEAHRNQNGPFVVEQQPDTNSYTIIYRPGTNANDTVEGTYTLTAAYESDGVAIKPAEMKLYLNKPEDRLNYMKTKVSGSGGYLVTAGDETTTADGMGKIIPVSCEVPYRKDNSVTVVTATLSTELTELANQWRVPGQYIDYENSSEAAFDILPDIRTEDMSKIDYTSVMARDDLEVTFSIVKNDNGKSVSLDRATGAVRYDNTVADESEFIYRLTATYNGVTRYVEYHLQFHTGEKDIKDIEIRPSAGQQTVNITVPESGKSATQVIQTVPFDQYNFSWNWTDLETAYKPGGRLNVSGENTYGWELYPVGTLPVGVEMTGMNNAAVVVTPQARSCSFLVKARFGRLDDNGKVVIEKDKNGKLIGGVESSGSMKVKIERPQEKVADLRQLEYENDTNMVDSPTIAEGDVTISPTFTVINQYGEEMAPESSDAENGYEAAWTYSVKSTRQDVATDEKAAEYIDVDDKTGVLTVRAGAPDCTVDITVQATPSDKLQRKSVKVTVKRGTIEISDMKLTITEPIDYPSREAEDSGRSRQLSVVATSNYSNEYTPIAVADLNWAISSVTFTDGKTYVSQADPTHPEYETFTGNTVRDSVSISTLGMLTFRPVGERAKVPTSITVTASYGGGTPFPLTIDVSPLQSKLYTLYFDPTVYDKGIQVPKASEDPVEFTLVCELQDQYGLTLSQDDYPVTWSLPVGATLPKGVTAVGGVDANGVIASKKISVDHTVEAPNGAISFLLDVTAQGASGEKVEAHQYIYLVRDVTNLSVGSVRDLAVRGHSDNTLELPASKTGSGYAAYTMTAVVCDQYDTPMGGAVTWNVESTTNGISARFTDTTGGVLRLNYTEEARDNNGGVITVKATSQKDTTKSAILNITVKLSDSEATYAAPVITDPGKDPETDSQGNPLPVVPTKNRPEDTVVKLRADVYDQYGTVMANEPATMKIAAKSMSSSLRLVQDTENTATLTISIGAKDSVTIEAALPEDAGTPQEESVKNFLLSKGPSYAYGLRLHKDNAYEFKLPTWESPISADGPADMATKDIVVRAEVIDQNDVWFETESARTYPMWEFIGEHEGIEFSKEMQIDSDTGKPKGEDLVLTVSGDAIKQEDPNKPVLTKDVTVKITTKNHEGEEDFTIEKTLHFTRDLPTPYRMYVKDMVGGTALKKLKRPTAEEGETVYRIEPVVYDQYGVEIKNAAVKVDLLTESVEQQGVVVEPIYNENDPKPAEGEPDTRVPIGYSLYRVEQSTTPGEEEPPTQDGEDKEDTGNKVLVGSFDCLTGEMKLYTASKTLKQLKLNASFAPLGETAGTRQVTVEIQMDEAKPTSVVIGELERIYYMQIVENAAAKAAETGEVTNITEVLRPLVYDQYGESFEDDSNLLVNWDLLVPNEDGTYTAYTEELGPDGLPRSGAELLVQKGRKRADNSWLITIQGAQFFEEKDLAVQCEVIDKANGNKQLLTVSPFSVLQFKNTHAPVVFDIEVTFDAGSYGKLVGPAIVPVNAGETVASPPGVKNIAGYGFVGWTTDGKTVVDPRQIPIFSSVTYYAVYKDITNTLFLEGYGNEARPNDLVTRAEFVSMVVRAMGGFDKTQSYGSSFTDVKAGQWYSNTVAYAKKTGIISGYTDGTFRPNATITRAEAAQILFTAGQYTSTGTTGSFPDVPANVWYGNAVEALTAAGVISGLPDGTYRPMNKLTRAEAVKLIVMITVNAPNELEYYNIRNFAYCPFKDVTKGHWAYVYILRAAGVA